MTTIVCICGSTRFRDEIAVARAHLTLLGEIVVGPEVLVRSDPAYIDLHDSEQKVMLDELHLRKIDMADYVYVVNPGGYIGDSTRREIEYTLRNGKPVQYLDAPNREIRADEDEFAPGECDGSGTCPAPVHVHGCYRSHRSDECDSPEEYGHTDRENGSAER